MSITEKELAEIKGRIAEGRRVPPFDVRDLADEVTRLRAELAKVREVTEETVERGAQAFYEYPTPGLDASLRTDWDRLTKASPDVADNYRAHTRAVLDALLGGGDDE